MILSWVGVHVKHANKYCFKIVFHVSSLDWSFNNFKDHLLNIGVCSSLRAHGCSLCAGGCGLETSGCGLWAGGCGAETSSGCGLWAGGWAGLAGFQVVQRGVLSLWGVRPL